MDGRGHADNVFESSIKNLSRFNLKENPFQIFELYEPGLDKKDLTRDEQLFRDRREIVQKIIDGIALSRSSKVVLHGDVGVGKSSLLNKILFILSENKYFTIKYRLSAGIKDAKQVEREFLRAFGGAIGIEAARNSGMLSSIKDLLLERKLPNERKSLEEISFLAILYASDLINITSGIIQTQGLSTTIGIPIINAKVSEEEQEQILVGRTETLSHTVFVTLLKRGFSLLNKLNFKGVVIGLDELDKLENNEIEKTIMTLLKDVFYTNASLAHIIVVLRQRNGLKPIYPDIFQYEALYAPPQGDVRKFLSQMYSFSAIDSRIPIDRFFDKKLLSGIYEKNNGRIRLILEELSNLLLSALPNEKIKKFDSSIYKKLTISVAGESYLRTLKTSDVDYKILEYLIQNKETYPRDEKLSKFTGMMKSALSRRLKALNDRSILATRHKGKAKIYFIDPSMTDVVRRVITS